MANGGEEERVDNLGKPLRPIRLSKEQRFTAVVVGLGLLAVGGWGYIASGHDGAGTVAFVVAGTLCGLLGIIGRVPTRLSGKDYSMEILEDADEVAETALGTMTKEQMVELVIGLDRDKRSTIVEVAMYKAAASSLAYEEMVTNLFLILSNELQMSINTHPNVPMFDLQLEASGKGRMLVAIKRSLTGGRALRRQLREISEEAKSHGARALVVTRSVSTFGLGIAAELPRLEIIQGETGAELAPKIEKLLT